MTTVVDGGDDNGAVGVDAAAIAVVKIAVVDGILLSCRWWCCCCHLGTGPMHE